MNVRATTTGKLGKRCYGVISRCVLPRARQNRLGRSHEKTTNWFVSCERFQMCQIWHDFWKSVKKSINYLYR